MAARRGSRPSPPSSAAVPSAPENANSVQLPTLIGDVGLKTLSMWWKRSGRPRSSISSTGLGASAATPTRRATRASSSRPAARATPASTDDAPDTPPVKKYQGISHVQTGSLMTGLS